MNCMKDENKTICTCKSMNCPNHGICCKCIANHKQSGGLPVCLRKED